MTVGKYALAFGVGLVIGARFLRPADSACCEIVGLGSRDKLAGYAGPLSGLASSALDSTGLTKLLPGIVTALGLKG